MYCRARDTASSKEARKRADVLACEAWNQRMLRYKGPAQPSPTLGDFLNGGYPRLHHAVWLSVTDARLVRKIRKIPTRGIAASPFRFLFVD
jgi:hypothetical protein